MKNPLYPLLSLVLGLFLLSATHAMAQEASATPQAALTSNSTTDHKPQLHAEEDEELMWMMDGLSLASDAIGITEEELFDALAHGLSMADVARAHGLDPIDLLDIAVSFEESEILEELLDEEINRQDAEEWREEAATDNAWLYYTEDPFGLEDIVWILDGASEVMDLDILELTEWMYDGVSLETIAKEMEVDLGEISDSALDYLDDTIEVMLMLEDIEEDEAKEWSDWSEESLDEMLAQSDLLDVVAEDLWADEMAETVADLLDLDTEELWEKIDAGGDIMLMLRVEGIKIEDPELEERIVEFNDWLKEDNLEDDAESEREHF
ncbi:MAG: hypothetical protein QM477_03415 [Planctomycetota bacterium]